MIRSTIKLSFGIVNANSLTSRQHNSRLTPDPFFVPRPRFRQDLVTACAGPVREMGYRAHIEQQYGTLLRLQDVQILQRVREPAILPRRGTIVINLYPIRALICADKMFLLLPDGSDGWLEKFLKDLRCACLPKSKHGFLP